MAKGIRERKERQLAEMDKRPSATASYVRMSPSKVSRVLDAVRGKKYQDALAILTVAPYASAEEVKQVLISAGANAEHNLGMNKDDLYVAECFANSGVLMKRMMPRAKGRGVRILKRTTHITVVLDTVK